MTGSGRTAPVAPAAAAVGLTWGPPPNTVDRLLPARPATTWADHLCRLGPARGVPGDGLAPSLARSGLRGRGGAGFPTQQKISAVSQAVRRHRIPAVVVANCCEGDPTSRKDHELIRSSPHLVIDGALAAAAAVHADRVVFAVGEQSIVGRTLAAALAERPDTRRGVDVAPVPERYVASEATALVRFLNTGDARPAGRLVPIWERGVDHRPTLVDNAETLAHLALLARFGADWFAGVGTAAEPGTSLVTVGGAVSRPVVFEVPNGTPLRAILAGAGAVTFEWALLGGLAGRWIDLRAIGDIAFSAADLARVGASKGVGSIIVLPPGGCLLAETARVLRYHADAGARQCGPCMFGLPAIADDFAALVRGDRGALDRLRRRLPVISGRGGCGHPDGAVGLAASALALLSTRHGDHLARHLGSGPCSAPPPIVPLVRSADLRTTHGSGSRR